VTRTYLVTAATGTVGQHVVQALADRDARVRVGSRDPDSARERFAGESADRNEYVAFDFTWPETWGRSLDGIDGVFLVRPPGVDASTVGAFAEAAARDGVSRLVYLSALGAEKNVLIPHHRIEKRVKATEATHTLLRASFFMQNLLEVHGPDIVEHGEVFVPAGDGKTSFVDARDIGEVASVALTESGHENRAYDLTGPEALKYEAVATIFSDVLGRPITYPKPSVVQFGRRMRRRGRSLGFVALMCGIYTTARLGLASRVTTDARHVLGREPRRMETFVRDYASEFRGDSERATTAEH
jgi:uncharacterized protein YbjT (DUF2867 family)